ncbi:MAG: DUF4350 domain-containing protein [Sphingomonadaceae bacterium]|nr:DUF4350 domain-containing protein [Sphingomonadaceae bacterium]
MTGTATSGEGAFNPRLIFGLIAAGVFGFIGFWVLTAFAPELSAGRDGGGHALSRAANGYAGIAQLLRVGGHGVTILRDAEAAAPGFAGGDGLTILTPSPATSTEALRERLRSIRTPVLVILPKYQVAPTMERDKVRRVGDAPNGAALAAALVPARVTTNVHATSPRHSVQVNFWDGSALPVRMGGSIQSIESPYFSSMVTADGRAVMVEVQDRFATTILAEPDFVNNLAMADNSRARAGLAMISKLAGPGAPIAFDVTLNGLGARQHNLLRQAFVPPFLGLTLCVIVATLFLLWQGFVRFGPPLLPIRVRAAGKAGLVQTSARLIVQAGASGRFAPRYAQMVREIAARRLHAPPGLDDTALGAWLDRFRDRRGRKFSELAGALDQGGSTLAAVDAAQKLAEWRKDVVRDIG